MRAETLISVGIWFCLACSIQGSSQARILLVEIVVFKGRNEYDSEKY